MEITIANMPIPKIVMYRNTGSYVLNDGTNYLELWFELWDYEKIQTIDVLLQKIFIQADSKMGVLKGFYQNYETGISGMVTSITCDLVNMFLKIPNFIDSNLFDTVVLNNSVFWNNYQLNIANKEVYA